jgi:hypothetical protein
MADQTCSGRIRLSPGATASIHDNALVILHAPRGRIFASNRTGARIWQCLEQQLPLEAIAAEISHNYGIERATAREDAANFLAELERNGLTERGAESCST